LRPHGRSDLAGRSRSAPSPHPGNTDAVIHLRRCRDADTRLQLRRMQEAGGVARTPSSGGYGL